MADLLTRGGKKEMVLNGMDLMLSINIFCKQLS